MGTEEPYAPGDCFFSVVQPVPLRELGEVETALTLRHAAMRALHRTFNTMDHGAWPVKLLFMLVTGEIDEETLFAHVVMYLVP